MDKVAQVPRTLFTGLIFLFGASLAPCQQAPALNAPPDPPPTVKTTDSDQTPPAPTESKRIFGIVPNYRTSPSLQNFMPITAKEKFKIASEDAFDRGTFVLAALFAGEAQLANSNRAFGQGAAGYGQYLGAAYGDFAIGDFMTEAIFPTFLHQDPRYFRRGTGGKWARFGYAVGQIFWTHTDAGTTQFNYSEVVGNSVAVAISNAYYRNNRDAGDNASKLGMQLGVDAAANVLKEFWPDLQRKFSRKHKDGD
jgi:hypothetical protein